MIKIHTLRPRELKQVLDLLAQYSSPASSDDSDYAVLKKLQQLYIPMQRISSLLPPQFQFLPALFVAASRDRVLGLIWLSRDGHQSRRWKIDQLILDPQEFSYDVGTQLVNYVINRYGGEGVQTFLAYVDQYNEQALGLLKSCGFRRCTRLHYYRHENPASLADQAPPTIPGIRIACNVDSEKLKELHLGSMPVEVRMSLEKARRDFSRSLFREMGDKLKGYFFKRWVVEDVARDRLFGTIEVVTDDYRNFYLGLMINPGWQASYEDLLRFGIAQIRQMANNAEIHLETYDFHKEELELLDRLGFQRTATAEVLVKDYWIPLEDKPGRLSSPVLLFSGKTSPAVNCR